MVAPFFVAATGALQGAALSTVISGPIQRAVHPVMSAIGQLSDALIPIELPPVDMLIKALYIDQPNANVYTAGMRLHGIDPNGPHDTQMWNKTLTALRPHIPLNLLAPLIAQAAFIPADASMELNRSGIRGDAAQQMWVSQLGLPSVAFLLEQYRLGTITREQFDSGMRAHSQTEFTWGTVLQRATDAFSTFDALDLSYRGFISVERAGKHLDADQLINPDDRNAKLQQYVWNKAPGLNELIRLRRLGVIPGNQFAAVARQAGHAEGSPGLIAEQATASMTSAQALDLMMRGLITPERAEQHIQSVGWVNDADREALKSARYHNPSVPEAIDYTRRVQFLIQSGDRWGIISNLPAQVASAATRTGWDDPSISFSIPGQGQFNVTPAEAAWYSSWRIPSVADVIGIWRHVTPMRAEQLRRNGLDVRTLDRDDIKAVLLANGIPEAQHGYTLGVATPNIPIRNLRMSARFGVLNHAGMVEHVLRLGYLREEAEIIVTTWEKQDSAYFGRAIVAANQNTLRRYIKAIERGYVEGVLSQYDAVQQLMREGFTTEDATTMLTVAEAEFQHGRVTESIKAIKRHFLHADYNVADAIAQLGRIGILEPRRSQLVGTWLLSFTPARKHVTTAKILQWLETGIITQLDAERRLLNLGWDQPDIVAYLAEARRKIDTLRAAALSAADKAKAARVRAVQQVAVQHQRGVKQTRALLRSLASPQRLMKWFRLGIISDKDFLRSMALLGFPQGIAENYLREALDAAIKKGKAKNAKQQQVESNGTAATVPEQSDGDVAPGQ